MNNQEEFIWVEKYRPRKIDDVVLPDSIKSVFKAFIAKGEIPNMVLTGTAGIGKTTVARAMLDEIGADYIVINGSLDRNIDTLRNEITNFASTVSFTGARKYVILDEADYLNPQSTQPALRNFMEHFSANCGFILTCNFLNKLLEPLHSRNAVIEFKIPKQDIPGICAEFFKRACGILDQEGVEYDKRAVASLVQKYYPDWRRTINELQRYSATGKIDEGVLANFSESTIANLIDMMKAKKFTDVRKWIAENSDMDASALYRSLYDTLPDKLADTQSVAGMIIILAEYQYKEAFVADSEINRAAAFATLMAEMDWK